MAEEWKAEAHEQRKQSKAVQEIADLLLRAREKRQPIPDLDPALRPASLEEAYAIQDAMAGRLGPVAGWKIGAPRPDATPLYGPMPMKLGLLHSGAIVPDRYSRLRGIEAEIAFLVRKDMPVREERYTREEILSSVAAAYPAIEVLESAFAVPDEATHTAMVADLQMNGGFVHGAACQNWQEIDIAAETLTIHIDGALRWEGGFGNTNGPDLLRLVEYLANEGQYRTGGLEVGQWITTGSWMGKLWANERSSVEVRFTHFGPVAVSFSS